ncbi:MAG TPA: VWA domain-containing protein [Gammaproteobacteria bacterium]|nr:VWA domain-containing protein [Gammaproteobacteria bacterium]
MARNRRQASIFSLSFLDVMSCGLGAVVLLFLIIKHNADAKVTETPVEDLRSEVILLEEEIDTGQQDLAKLRNTLSDLDDQLAMAQGLARRIMDSIEREKDQTANIEPASEAEKLERLKQEIIRLETERQKLLTEANQTGENIRRYVGEGNRAYITGLRLGGRRILILLDASGSMLDRTIVNILRIRNMRDERKRLAPKWLNAVATVDWLSARLPLDSKYQIYTFNTRTAAALPDTLGRWLEVKDKQQISRAVEQLRTLVPEGGTNMEQVFRMAREMSPPPDNIILITDGLPTQDNRGGAGNVTGKQRLQFFSNALKQLPKGVPVNVILEPLEGDPDAPTAFWQLAQATAGSYMSPTRDWP